MIPRYTRKKIEKIWTLQNKFSIWTEIECLIADKLSSNRVIPEDAGKKIRKKIKFNVKEIENIEKNTKHDVVAYVENVSKSLGENSKYFHYGVTSSDIIDTSFSIQLKQSADIIINDLKKLLKEIKIKALKYKNTMMMGRSHGVHAEPITFGLKLALWSEEIKRHIHRFKSAIQDISHGKISGAVGTYQHLDPSVENRTCKKLGLKASSVSNQVVQRDHHAYFVSSLALIGCTIEKIAVEIRHLQRTEVLEAEEFFAKGQKGSSAMPHKRNPIITERLTGFARLLRAHSMAAMENVALWHERDISHSSVERIIIPDATNLMDYMLIKLNTLFENLIVYPENMMRNLNLTNGLIFSQEVLLNLVQKGISREKAYQLVQRNAMQVWEQKKDFKELLKLDDDILNLMSTDEIDSLFNLDKILVNIDKTFERLGL